MRSIEPLLRFIRTWAEGEADIVALALVGSWARGAQCSGSDIDLMILARDPLRFRRDESWLRSIGWAAGGFRVAGWQDAQYGVAWSRHVRLEPASEVECTFAAPDWARFDPVDAGTRRVISGGCRPLLDKAGLFRRLLVAAAPSSASHP